jgi:hypothetical protein
MRWQTQRTLSRERNLLQEMTRLFVIGLVCCGLSDHATAQDAAKGAALLADARRAIGGEDRLAGVKTLDVRGDFKRVAGQTTIQGELQVRIERPDKLRRDEDLSPPGGGPAIIRTEVLNGTTVWDENSGGRAFLVRQGRGGDAGRGARGNAPNIDPAQLEDLQRRARQAELARFLLIWLLAADGPVNWVATAEAPDGKADVLDITPASGPMVRLFLDQTTHLPLMITWQGTPPQMVFAGRRGGRDGGGDDAAAAPPPRQGAQPATLQLTLGEYKTVGGIKLPHLITRGVSDMTIEEWTIDSYRINQSFRSGVFAK